MDNKEVTIKPGTVTKEIKQMEMKKVVMDFGSFQKAYPNLSEPTSVKTGDKLFKKSGDKDEKQITKATDTLTESVKSLLKEHSSKDLINMILEMDEMEEDSSETHYQDPADENADESASTEEENTDECDSAVTESKKSKKKDEDDDDDDDDKKKGKKQSVAERMAEMRAKKGKK